MLAIIKADKDLQAGNPRKVVELAEQKVLPHFDFARMTRLAVGRNWSQASDAQKEALVKEFSTLLVRTYSASLTAVPQPDDRGEAAEDGRRATPMSMVRTAVIQQGGPPIPIDYSMEKAGERLEGLRREDRRRLARDHLPRQLQRPDPEGRHRRPDQDAADAQQRGSRRRPRRRSERRACRGEVLALEGALSFETPARGARTRATRSPRDRTCPKRLTIDFAGVTDVDSSAVALLLEWRRQAQRQAARRWCS